MDIALFSPSSLFSEEDDIPTNDENSDTQEIYVERKHQFPGMELIIREFSFHQLNANLLWPGTFAFAEWLVQHRSYIEGRRAIELGSGTGALAIFLLKTYNLDITTSDYEDQEIEDNIAHNCRANEIPVIPHIKHTWGDKFPNSVPDWDLIIASDILLYVKQYANLIQTISFLLKCYKPGDRKALSRTRDDENAVGDVVLPWPAFLMSWRRRIGKEDELLFFNGCENAGLKVQHIGSRVYCVVLKGNESND
ncbi:putative lysine methyltransferase, S-adenosyl-L-methionine-dependent methyltransferase [Lupinus albus]|uniref:Putative lysine methyltransferase, S-adenosyl-L-methionine-dependent methyltransferase n=1 Tax=Lupinus albus TaxID=3870 RepID=A0A6A4QAT4_LUPAL|nr:putative lysine methyltransferase, S-adenosyl-L-methionine-dependent methyltransferase [Lupinus albus]